MTRSPQWMDLYQIWFRVSSRGRNQLCGILLQSAHGFRFCEGSKFAISHWLGRSPLTQCQHCVNAQPVKTKRNYWWHKNKQELLKTTDVCKTKYNETKAWFGSTFTTWYVGICWSWQNFDCLTALSLSRELNIPSWVRMAVRSSTRLL